MKYYGNIEYRMSKEMANNILKTRKGNDQRINAQKYLCKYVNDVLGIKGNCILVTTTL